MSMSTIVRSSFLAGEVMITFFTGSRRCAAAFPLSVNLPVNSMTMFAPTRILSGSLRSFYGSALLLVTRMFGQGQMATKRQLVVNVGIIVAETFS